MVRLEEKDMEIQNPRAITKRGWKHVLKENFLANKRHLSLLCIVKGQNYNHNCVKECIFCLTVIR